MKLGENGHRVAELQGALVKAGIEVPLSGYFGASTLAGVETFMKKPLGSFGREVPESVVDLITLGKKLFEDEANNGHEIASLWLEKAEKIAPRSVYGPGRGSLKNGVWVVSDTWHCNSIFTFLLHWWTNQPRYFHHSNIPPLKYVLENDGPQVYNGQYHYMGFDRHVDPMTIRGKKVVPASEVGMLDDGVYFCIESTWNVQEKKWRWGHHCSALIVVDGVRWRWAADGYKGKRGYSRTPMSLGAFDQNKEGKLYQLYRLLNKPINHGRLSI